MSRIRQAAPLFVLLTAFAVAEPGRGGVSIIGTSDGEQVLRAISVAYRAGGATTPIAVPPGIGSSGAVAAVGNGTAELGRISRDLTPTERASGLVSEPLFRLDVAFVAHPGNGVERLSAQQLRAIFSGAVASWRELGGQDLRIRIVRRDEADSALAALRASLPGWRDLTLSPRGALAANAAEALETVRAQPGAISFVPYLSTFGPDIRTLSIDGLRPGSPDYPHFLTLALVYRADRLGDEGRALIRFATGAEARRVARGFGARASGE